uniref:Putative conserved plasma membrane protein n=1 Tax=Corethrella appendiculata TaxID=1370023 RepID=U5ESA9_9DIPT
MNFLKFNFVISLIVLLISNVCCVDVSDLVKLNKWVKPNAWSQYEDENKEVSDGQVNSVSTESCDCPPPPACNGIQQMSVPSADGTEDFDKDLALIFYKKFVRYIFDMKQVQRQPSSEYLITNLNLKITESQLKHLGNAETAQDIDNIISDIVEQTGRSEQSFFQLFTGSECNLIDFKTYYHRFLDSKYFDYMFTALIFLIVVLIVRIYKFKGFGLILLFFFIYSCRSAYNDCNQRLEIEELVELMHFDGKDPCEYRAGANTNNFWSHVKDFFGKSDKTKCIEFLQKKHGNAVNGKRCDVIKVVNIVITNYVMDVFTEVCLNLVETFKTVIDSNSNWFNRIIIAALFAVFLYVIITSVLQYSIYGFFGFLTNRSSPSMSAQIPPNIHQGSTVESIQNQQQIPQVINVNVNLKQTRKIKRSSKSIESIQNVEISKETDKQLSAEEQANIESISDENPMNKKPITETSDTDTSQESDNEFELIKSQEP